MEVEDGMSLEGQKHTNLSICNFENTSHSSFSSSTRLTYKCKYSSPFVGTALTSLRIGLYRDATQEYTITIPTKTTTVPGWNVKEDLYWDSGAKQGIRYL